MAATSSSSSEAPANKFLVSHKEKLTLNQYWYSAATIGRAVAEIERASTRCAFLSTPSIYFSLTNRAVASASVLFDYDEMWRKHPGFVKYDYKQPEAIPSHLHHTFDMVVIDPPFITPEVWKLYAQATKMLLVEGSHHVSLCRDCVAQMRRSSKLEAAEAERQWRKSTGGRGSASASSGGASAGGWIGSLAMFGNSNAPASSGASASSPSGAAAPFPFIDGDGIAVAGNANDSSMYVLGASSLCDSARPLVASGTTDANNPSPTASDNTTVSAVADASKRCWSCDAQLALSVGSDTSGTDAAAFCVRVPRGKVLLSTIPEHRHYLFGELGVRIANFRPSIPNLIYQYSFYINYPSLMMNMLNPEIDQPEPEPQPPQRANPNPKTPSQLPSSSAGVASSASSSSQSNVVSDSSTASATATCDTPGVAGVICISPHHSSKKKSVGLASVASDQPCANPAC